MAWSSCTWGGGAGGDWGSLVAGLFKTRLEACFLGVSVLSAGDSAARLVLLEAGLGVLGDVLTLRKADTIGLNLECSNRELGGTLAERGDDADFDVGFLGLYCVLIRCCSAKNSEYAVQSVACGM